MIYLYNRNVFTLNTFVLAKDEIKQDLVELRRNYLKGKVLTLKIVRNILAKDEDEEISFAPFFNGEKDIETYCRIIRELSIKQTDAAKMEEEFPDFCAFAKIYDEYIRLRETRVLMDNEYSLDMKTRAENNQMVLNLVREIKPNRK